METTARTRRTRFGAFEVDLRSATLHKHGIRLKLQDQPFHVLAILLECPGEVVTREKLRQKLWPADTFVDFDTGLNSAVKKLRDVLADSADEPRYIETLPRRGYRFIADVEIVAMPGLAVVEDHHVPVVDSRPTPRLGKQRRFMITAVVGVLLIAAALVTWRVFFARPVLTGTDVIVLAGFVNKTGDPIFNDSLALGVCAEALGNAGDVKQVEELTTRLDRLRPEDTVNQKVVLPLIRSIVERNRGNAMKAVVLLAPVKQYEQNCWQVPYHRAQAYLAAGEYAKAAGEFEKLIGHRGWDGWEIFAPLTQLGLARTYAMQGDHAESRRAYEEFFSTWKNADPNIPILRQARAEYKKISGTAPSAVSP